MNGAPGGRSGGSGQTPTPAPAGASNAASPPPVAAGVAAAAAPQAPRPYQAELLAAAMRGNLLVSLPTGAGKTWIGAALLGHFARLEAAAGGGGGANGDAAGGGGGGGGGGGRGGTPPPSRRLGLFLVPKVPLVAQQAAVLRAHTGLRVGTYCGARRVDMWSAERWATDVEVHDVGVATPQTILDALRHGLLHAEDFPAIVFDECHHVSGNDAYAQLLREFFAPAARDPAVQGAAGPPRLLGLTASPLKRVADSTHTLERCTAALAGVELTYGAPLRALSPAAAAAVAAVAVRPREATAAYTPSRLELEQVATDDDGPDKGGGGACSRRAADLKAAEELLAEWGAFDDGGSGLGAGGAPTRNAYYRSAAERTTAYVVAVLGRRAGELWAAHLLVPAAAAAYAREPALSDKATVVRDALVAAFDRLTGVAAAGAAAAAAPPAAGVLVFVARRVIAWALAALLSAVATPSDARIRAGYVVGHRSGGGGSGGTGAATPMSWTAQRTTLAALRSGTLSVIVCTSVLAEGLDVPHVATILLTDGAASPTTYVQARGRARDARATLLWLIPQGDPPSLEGLPGRTVAASMALARRGAAMMERALGSQRAGGAAAGGSEKAGPPAADAGGQRDGCGGGGGSGSGDNARPNEEWAATSDLDLGPPPREPTPTVYSTTTRARVNTHSALSLLARYCTSLQTVREARAGAKAPTFAASTWPLQPPGPPFAATVTLPAGAPVRQGTCASAATVVGAKRLAALDACARLYQAGALDEWMLPRDAHLEGLLWWHRRSKDG